MEKIKKISAALIALTMACGIMASCGDSTESNSNDDAKTTSAAAAENDGDDADGDSADDENGDADDNGDAAGGDETGGDEAADASLAEFTPDPDYVHNYEFAGYDAYLMFADNPNWMWSNFEGEGNVHADDFDETDATAYGYGVDADIVGDGEYTVSLTKDSIYSSGNGYTNPQTIIDEDNGTIFPAEGVSVFCVDIIGLMDGEEISGMDENGEWVQTEAKKNKLKDDLDPHYNVEGKGKYKPSDLTVTVTSIKVDGVELDFDASKILYGNIEDNNNRFRIEIYNSYGKTAEDSPIGDPFSLTFNKSLEVTFTIEGLGDLEEFPEVTPFGNGASADSTADEGAEAPAEDAAADEETAE